MAEWLYLDVFQNPPLDGWLLDDADSLQEPLPGEFGSERTPPPGPSLDEPSAETTPLGELLTIRMDQIVAVLLVCSAVVTLFRPGWLVLVPVAFWQVAVALASWQRGGHFLDELTIFAQATRIFAPLALARLASLRQNAPDNRLLDSSVIVLLRYAAAATFIAHGIEAICQNGVFLDYLLGTSREWFGVALSETTARWILWVIGVQDLLIGHLLILARLRSVALWMALWGFVTAASRITHAGWPAYHEVLMRTANGGVPLALALVWWHSHRVGTAGEDPDQRPSSELSVR